jgi:hypothetical protein
MRVVPPFFINCSPVHCRLDWKVPSICLCEIYSNTQSGQKFADKTLRQLRRQQARNHDVAMVVYAGAYFAVFNAKYLIWLLLDAPKDAQERLKPHFMAGFT